MSMITTTLTPEIITQAHAVWEAMYTQAVRTNMARTKHDGDDGRILIASSTAVLKGLGTERNWELDPDRMDLIMRYLTFTRNLVPLNAMGHHNYRMFVREDWTNAALASLPPAGRETSLPPTKERIVASNETVAPVTHKCDFCGKTFDTDASLRGHKSAHADDPNYLSRDKKRKMEREKRAKAATPTSKPAKKAKKPGGLTAGGKSFPEFTNFQQAIIRAMVVAGGEIYNESGFAAQELSKLANLPRKIVTSSQRTLDDRGLLKREITGKRTYRYTLTKKGYAEAKRLGYTSEPAREPELVEDETPKPVVTPTTEVTRKVTDTNMTIPLEQVGNRELIRELEVRLVDAKLATSAAERLDQATEKLELIGSLVKEVNAGELAPLRALSDIEEALKW
jgi:predicted transcriptional regulator